MCEVHSVYIYIYICVCETEKERRRSGGRWRNEGVQGQSEGTDLFGQTADEELIWWENFFAAEVDKEVLINSSEEL